jgi:hypothetical protein
MIVSGVGLCVLRAEVPSELLHYREKNGFPPDESVLFSFTANLNDPGMAKNIVNFVLAEQKPMISRDDIVKIIRAKQNSITSFECKYLISTSESLPKNGEKDENIIETCEFLFSANKLLLDQAPSQVNAVNPHTRKSYDGDRIISLHSFGNDQHNAGISPVEDGSRKNLIRQDMPLMLAMIFDTSRYDHFSVRYDLLKFLSQDYIVLVLEKLETVQGRKCVVVADFSSRFYLDIERDYSVVRAEQYGTKRNNGILERYLYYRTTLYDLRDMGNGIWLPQKALLEHFNEQKKLVDQSFVHVQHMELNKNIDEKRFYDFIPDDILVSDTVTGAVYKWGDRPSIDATLKSVVKSKRQWFWQIASMTTGIILIIIWIIIKYVKYRAYLKAKNAE